MLLRILNLYRIFVRRFGFSLRPLAVLLGLGGLRVIVTIGMMLDNLFFPRWRKIRLDRPIFVVGNPRSGTTFLHRFLIDAGVGCGFRLWQMLFPSIILRRLAAPLIERVSRLEVASDIHVPAIHETGLMSYETDDLLTFTHYLDGVFYYGYFLAWDVNNAPMALRLQGYIQRRLARDFAWLSTCMRRNQYCYGQQRVVGKLFSMSLYPASVLEAYPDAKIIYIVRDPMMVVPSMLSLISNVIDKRIGLQNISKDALQRFYGHLYEGCLLLYRSFYDMSVAGKLPQKNVLVVRYHEMMSDFERVMSQIVEFVEVERHETLHHTIRTVAARQASYRSKHGYRLEQFGLSAECILRDFSFVYDEYGIPRPSSTTEPIFPQQDKFRDDVGGAIALSTTIRESS